MAFHAKIADGYLHVSPYGPQQNGMSYLNLLITMAWRYLCQLDCKPPEVGEPGLMSLPDPRALGRQACNIVGA